MSMRIHSLWREPLLHFLLLGAALFLYYQLAGDNVEAPPKRIHVERGQMEQLTANFQRTWSRPPTPDELDAMVESYVREEVFYREALAMGLDRDDPLVRRRLRMKLEFMLEDLASQDVDDAVLEGFLQDNAERFRSEPRTTFRQVFLDPVRYAQLQKVADDWLARLRAGADVDTAGDPTLAPREFRLAGQSEVARVFGADFAAEIAALPVGDWSGPVWSPFGAHLVFVGERVAARLPGLAEIRERVLRDYQAEQSRLQKDLVYQRLREGYEISVDSLTPKDGVDGAQ